MHNKKYGDMFVFDADDTLWMNEWQYSHAYATFFTYLYDVLGDRMPNLHRVREHLFEVDGKLFDTWGVKRGRVAEAMVRTYVDICEWIALRFGEDVRTDTHEARIRKIGDLPFDYTKLRFLPQVRPVLEQLMADGARLHLLTSYDTSVFVHKAEFLGLHAWFAHERIRAIEGKKKAQDFIEVSGYAQDPHRTERQWYAIGNGESDIMPALGIAENWRGIYIPHGSTSAYFKGDGAERRFTPPPLDHPRVITIRDFREIYPSNSALRNRDPFAGDVEVFDQQ